MLTARHREIIGYLAHGYSFREIGEEMGISTSAVKHHSERLRKKFNVETARELPAAFRELTGEDPYEELP